MHKMAWPKVNDDHGMLMKIMMLMLCMWKDATITLGCYIGPSEQEAYGAGGSKHHEPGHSSDSEWMPPPVRPQVTLDVLNTHMGGLELQNRQIQGTLNAHIQTATQWHQQTHRASSTLRMQAVAGTRHRWPTCDPWDISLDCSSELAWGSTPIRGNMYLTFLHLILVLNFSI